jgi:hypothetical protein
LAFSIYFATHSTSSHSHHSADLGVALPPLLPPVQDELLECDGHAVLGDAGGDPVCGSVDVGGGVGHGDPETGPFEHADVVAAVADGHRFAAVDAEVAGEEGERVALGRGEGTDLDEERVGADDGKPVSKAVSELGSEVHSLRSGSPMKRPLSGRLFLAARMSQASDRRQTLRMGMPNQRS